MKKILTISLILVSMAIISSCSNTTPLNPLSDDSKFIGNWYCYKTVSSTTTNYTTDNTILKLHFKSDKTVDYINQYITVNYNWSTDSLKKELYLKINDQVYSILKYNFISDSEFSFNFTSFTTTYYMKKY